MDTADIKGAYMKSGPIIREVFVRQLRDGQRKRGVLWKLLKLPNGMMDAGIQWIMRVENWILGAEGMRRVTGVNQGLNKTEGGTLKLILVTVIDNF